MRLSYLKFICLSSFLLLGACCLHPSVDDVMLHFQTLSDLLKNVSKHEQLEQIKSGLPSLDNLIPIVQRGLVVLSGEPGSGKTSLVSNIAVNSLTTSPDLSCVFVTSELSIPMLIQRMLVALANVGIQDLNAALHKTPPEAHPQISSALSTLRGIGDRIIFLDLSDVAPCFPHVQDLILSAFDFLRQPQRLLIVDSIQNFVFDALNMQQVVDSFVGSLSVIAQENVAVLGISQMPKGTYDSTSMSSLAYSTRLPFVADAIAFLRRKQAEENPLHILNNTKRAQHARPSGTIVTVRSAKNRLGPLGETELLFIPRYYRFEEVPHGPVK